MHYKRACGLFYIKARNQKCANTDEGYLPMQRIIFSLNLRKSIWSQCFSWPPTHGYKEQRCEAAREF